MDIIKNAVCKKHFTNYCIPGNNPLSRVFLQKIVFYKIIFGLNILNHNAKHIIQVWTLMSRQKKSNCRLRPYSDFNIKENMICAQMKKRKKKKNLFSFSSSSWSTRNSGIYWGWDNSQRTNRFTDLCLSRRKSLGSNCLAEKRPTGRHSIKLSLLVNYITWLVNG